MESWERQNLLHDCYHIGWLCVQDVVDRCAALSAKPDAIQNLIGAMDKLSDIYHDVEAMLNEIMELIQVIVKHQGLCL